jgi:PAS domain S-box-containing protein
MGARDKFRLAEEERRAMNAMPTTAWTVRPDGTVDFLNQRYLQYTGLSLEQALAAPTATVHPDDLPGVIEGWSAAFAAGRAYEADMRVRRADGEYHWFHVRTMPRRDRHGHIVRWYGASFEIEEPRRAEESSSGRRALAPQSAREREVLTMLAEGQTVAHIALRLSISRKTVETFRQRAMKKLRLKRLPALVKFALKHGLIALE